MAALRSWNHQLMTHDSTNLPLTTGEGEVIIACVRTAQCHHKRGEQDGGTEGVKQQQLFLKGYLRRPGLSEKWFFVRRLNAILGISRNHALIKRHSFQYSWFPLKLFYWPSCLNSNLTLFARWILFFTKVIKIFLSTLISTIGHKYFCLVTSFRASAVG